MQGFAWASNYLDWYVYLPGICTLPGYGAHDAEPCTHPAFVSIVTAFGPLAAPRGPLFGYLGDALNGG